MNNVTIIGRLTRDPELNYQAGSGKAYCKFCVAVTEYNYSTKEKEAQFFDCIAFEKKAEVIATYMTKGREMAVNGKLKKSRYTNKDGTVYNNVVIYATDVSFLGSKKNADNANDTDSFSELGFGAVDVTSSTSDSIF